MMDNVCLCDIDNDDYPLHLKQIKKKTNPLYYLGDISILNKYKSVAIIGKRNCNASSEELAFKSGQIAANNGLIVINGLANGCDTMALKGALREGGRCVAILPGGLDNIYPKNNILLSKEIVKRGGCLISEYPNGFSPKKYTFVERDKIQSGLSNGVLVIECEEKGGTMHTVNAAIRQNKRVAAYAERLVNHASGNSYIAKIDNSRVVESDDNLVDFFVEIKNDTIAMQMSFF